MLAAIPLIWRVAGILAIVAGAYFYIDHQGYRRAELEWTVKYQQREHELEVQRFKELERQAAINDQAKADEMAQIEQLERDLQIAQDLAEQLADEASRDPSKDVVAFDAGAVDRYNRRIGK